MSNWFDGIEGLSDSHKQFIQEKKIDSVASLIDSYPKETKSWVDSLTPEYKGLVESKGFKEPADLIKSYENLEKLKGVPEKQLLRIPEKTYEEDKAAWDSLFSRLGKPEKPDDYKWEVPEGVQEDKELVSWAKNTFHELGLTTKQAEMLMKNWTEFAGKKTTEMTEASKAKLVEEEKALKTKWGMAFDKNVKIAENVAKKFGVSPEVYNAMLESVGAARTMELFHAIGEQFGEHTFIGSNDPKSTLKSPEAAMYEISQLKQDKEFGKKLVEGDREATRKWEKLHEQAYVNG